MPPETARGAARARNFQIPSSASIPTPLMGGNWRPRTNFFAALRLYGTPWRRGLSSALWRRGPFARRDRRGGCGGSYDSQPPAGPLRPSTRPQRVLRPTMRPAAAPSPHQCGRSAGPLPLQPHFAARGGPPANAPATPHSLTRKRAAAPRGPRGHPAISARAPFLAAHCGAARALGMGGCLPERSRRRCPRLLREADASLQKSARVILPEPWFLERPACSRGERET